ncbi:MAG: Rrf2 family transcriptional regulator [Candidatus Omnitrophica bacterium]|nr:Rrf2 family transcriptional regulator [Candidatus Omnitrophota bacterium]
MKLITRDTDYALRALCFIAKEKERIVAVSELVKELKIPKPFLRKILQSLHKHGVLAAYKGVGGGFKLARPANKIFLFDLLAIFQQDWHLNECLFKKMLCPNVKKCVLKKRIDKIEDFVRKELSSISIASLVG